MSPTPSDVHNLWRMRNFYLNYRDAEKLAPLVREISWSNNVVIMEKCKNDLQKEFYLQMTIRYGWTKRILTNIWTYAFMHPGVNTLRSPAYPEMIEIVEHVFSRKRQENEKSLTDKNSLESLGNKILLEKSINIRASDY